MSIVFLREDGHNNIYDENGNEAMGIVEESEEFNIKQLVNYNSYNEEKSNNSPLTEPRNDDIEMEAIQEKSKKRETKRIWSIAVKKEKCFSSINKTLCRFEVLRRELVLSLQQLKSGGTTISKIRIILWLEGKPICRIKKKG
jgi:hypothetical protein